MDGKIIEEENGDESDNVEDEKEYINTMKNLQFEYAKLFGGEYIHHYLSEIQSCSHSNKERIMRLAQETGTLTNSLPLNDSSSVFVRVDEDRIDTMSALITGPSGTPYSNGCFVFDIFFPSEYPNGPPHVWLTTTGNNSFRFNPNLYANGKVCLSLLGTWQGSQGENWNKETSTFLQVLVSIQSLILVPDPFFNEPGYEKDIGTIHGSFRSSLYNFNIREGCVRWAMVNQLRKPPIGFEEIIRNHFRMRKKAIWKEFAKWRSEAGVDFPHLVRLNGLIAELETEINKL